MSRAVVRSCLALCLALVSLAAAAKVPLPDDLFRLAVARTESGDYRLTWSVAPESYLYRDRIVVTARPGGPRLPLATRPGTLKDDPTFGETEVYYGTAEATLAAPAAAGAGTILVTYQGCAEIGICYPPVTKAVDPITLAITDADTEAVPAEPDSAEPAPAGADPAAPAELGGSLLSTLAAFLGFGLLLAFTPCVFPMIPILSGLLARAGEGLSARRGFALSATYVLAMAGAYGALGVAAALSGQNLQMALQTPWAIGAMSALFTAFALSMFGLFELRLPHAWTNFVAGGTAGRGGSLPAAAFLGFTSALIVGPCVTPPLAAALLYAAQTGDAGRGAAALAALGLGMGLPLVAFGTLGARALPKAGPWLVRVKQIFGIVFLAVAVALLSRILPSQATLALAALLAIGTGVFLGALDGLARTDGAGPRLARTAGVAALLYGAALVAGAAGGATDPVRPLAFLAPAPRSAGEGAEGTRVTSPAALDAAVRAARAQGKPVLVDFTAEWCGICQEIERTVFADPVVQTRLQRIALVRVDVTAADGDSRALMRRFAVAGPPTLLVLDPRTGREMPGTRLVGRIGVNLFLDTINRAGL